MELVSFVLCMSIIAHANAAALINGSPHYKFEVPEVARGGFEMVLNALINKKIQEELVNQSLAAKFDIQDGQGLQIYIIKADKKEKNTNKSGEPRSDTIDLRLKVTQRARPGKLLLQVFLNDDFQNEAETTFEKLQHISIEGVIEDVNQLHFDFTEEAS